MSETEKRIMEVVRLGLAPALKAEGFRKRAKTFHRESPASIEVVNVQGSRFNQGTDGQFTVNVGVYFPAVTRWLGDTAPRGLPAEYECTLRERIGPLMPSHRDHWWKVSSRTDLVALAREVTEAWEAYARPWLARMAEPTHAVAELERTGLRAQAAALHLELGQRPAAERLWREALAGTPTASRLARSWGAVLGFSA